jgi:hypothetical protein
MKLGFLALFHFLEYFQYIEHGLSTPTNIPQHSTKAIIILTLIVSAYRARSTIQLLRKLGWHKEKVLSYYTLFFHFS